jgi:thymidylate synthase
MAKIDLLYNKILSEVLSAGKPKTGRTAEGFLSIPGSMLSYNMSDGFPLLTTKRIATRVMMTELEGFLHGVTSKKWYQDRGCRIWNSWCNPSKVPYGASPEAREAMFKEDDLGPIYGAQWRSFNSSGHDQLMRIIDELTQSPGSRRMVCSAWNPLQLSSMALPPCHVLWQVLCDNDGTLHLNWYQRSVDVPVGLPFDIGFYGMLLTLLAKETNKVPGTLTGFFGDTHIYNNQIDLAWVQLTREPRPAPALRFVEWSGLFNWTSTDTVFDHYYPYDAIPYPVAV